MSNYPPGVSNADFDVYGLDAIRPPERVVTIFDDCGELRWDANGACLIELEVKFSVPRTASVLDRELLAISALESKLALMRELIRRRQRQNLES